MAGHSKWANIKHRKGAQDAKRAKVFSKISKLIKAAVKEGGSGDPEMNPQLRVVLDKAKEANMPKDNIQRAIDRGLGKSASGAALQEKIYEGFGPQGIGMVIVASTDNEQRTGANVRYILNKAGGSLGGPNTVMYMFERTQSGDFQPTMPMELDDQQTISKLQDIVEQLEEDDDVDEVYLAATWEGKDQADE
jgi:YebC/PmpR family DNA-binding regulatory protein